MRNRRGGGGEEGKRERRDGGEVWGRKALKGRWRGEEGGRREVSGMNGS